LRFVERPADSVPNALSNPGVGIKRERKAAAQHYFRADLTDPNFAGFVFKEYNQKPVKRALAAIFKGKCAYCELDCRAAASAEIEHYRPKAAVDDEVHPGYWWLAHSWSNMLYSCPACNQRRLVNVLDEFVTPEEFERLLNGHAASSHGKGNYFPVAGVRALSRKDDLALEQPLLIEPTLTDPSLHLEWMHGGPQSMVRARIHDGEPDPRGVASIKGYALNRVPLIASRNAAVKVLRAQRLQILDRLQETLDDGIDREVALARARRAAQAMRANYDDDQPFTAMALAYAEELELELVGMAAKADG
jgi:hypothetical protein